MSMNLLAVAFCRRLRCNLYNPINCTTRRYNKVADNEKYNVHEPIKSERFPGYSVIYSLPYIIYASLLNKVKRNFTVLWGASIPVTGIMQMLSIISTHDSVTFLFTNSLLCLSLHGCSYLCSNMVGSICYKEDDQKVVISYINYWGLRKDLMINVNNITPLPETPLNKNHEFYRLLNIKSCDEKLKLYYKYGKMIDKSHFYNVFGDVK